jgi:repressor LexA
MGSRLRRQRRKLGLTLDELAAKAGISKPYLSLIETGKTQNPPSDSKLAKLEQVLGFPTGELLSQAHWTRTPSDVKAILHSLLKEGGGGAIGSGVGGGGAEWPAVDGASRTAAGISLDRLRASGALAAWTDVNGAGNAEPMRICHVPVINKVSAGYPKDFTDKDYPARIADDYVPMPEIVGVPATDSFAARVSGDSMSPRYADGEIIVFSAALDPADGDDCFVRLEDGQTTFKRVYFVTTPDGLAVVELRPRNPKYITKRVAAERIAGLYRAVSRVQTLIREEG